jgi:hypothetical protein
MAMFECLKIGDSTGVGTSAALIAQQAIRCDLMAVEFATEGTIFTW